MAPIYETDVAEERWSKSEWNHYELWEKVEQRLRRHNRLWIALTVLIFLLLSSVPIVMDQRPRWKALSAVRTLGQEINRIKREAGAERSPYRIRFQGDGTLAFQVERVTSCHGGQPGTVVRTGSILPASESGAFTLLSHARGEALSVPGLVEEFCYDPFAGSSLSDGQTEGFGVMPVKDLAQEEGRASRMNRLAILLLSGPSAELSFE